MFNESSIILFYILRTKRKWKRKGTNCV